MSEIFVLFVFFSFISIGFAVLCYVFEALGLMAMLKKCNVKNAHFAWIPFLRIFALGKLSEQYDNGKPPKKSGLMLSILYAFYMGIFLVGYIVILISLMSFVLKVAASVDVNPEAFEYSILKYMFDLMLWVIIWYLAVLALAIVYTVFFYIALYRVFEIFYPKGSGWLIVLCIFINIAIPFVLFALRNKEPQNLRSQKKPDFAPFPPQYYNYGMPYQYTPMQYPQQPQDQPKQPPENPYGQ